MPLIGVISNPYSRSCRKNAKFDLLIRNTVGDRGLFASVSTIPDLNQTAFEFHKRGITHVAIVGGDGTISLTLSALSQAYGEDRLPRIVTLRGGTMNVLASNLGVSGPPRLVLAEFLAKYQSAPGLIRDISLRSLKVNGRLGFVFANGIASRFLQAFYRNKGSALDAALFLARIAAQGIFDPPRLSEGASVRIHRFLSVLSHQDPFKYRSLFRLISYAEPMKIATQPSLQDYEGTQAEDVSLVMVSTMKKMAFGLPVFDFLDSDRDEAAILISGLTGRALARASIQSFFSDRPSHQGVYRGLIKNAELVMPKGSLCSIDGDLFESDGSPINIEIGPRIIFCSPYEDSPWG